MSDRELMFRISMENLRLDIERYELLLKIRELLKRPYKPKDKPVLQDRL